MPEVLLVFSPQDAQVAARIKDQLEAAPDVNARVETNAERALLNLTPAHDAIVVASALGPNPREPVAADGGLAFCRQARTKSNAPIVLLTPAPLVPPDVHVACVALVPPAHPVADEQLVATLVAALLKKEAPQQRPSFRLEITITVQAEPERWSYTMRGVGFDYLETGSLAVPKSASMCWTDLHYSRDYWYGDFSRVGTSIKTCLCEENKHFAADREKGITKAIQQAARTNIELKESDVDTQLVFIVAKEHYRLVLEAVFNPCCPEPWLAHAPMVRRMQGTSSQRGALFKAVGRPLKALVVCADTWGEYASRRPPLALGLHQLEMVVDECQRVEEVLTQPDPVSGRVWFDEVKVLGRAGEPVSERDLLDALMEDEWDLIHFAGHSYFQAPLNPAEAGMGYVFVGPPEKPEAIKFSFLAPFLGKARFVYLSSCESGNSSFADEATAAGIHSILGYRWRVGDKSAHLQAELFYQELLRHHSVDTAFWTTRRELYRRYGPKEAIWASATLVTPEN